MKMNSLDEMEMPSKLLSQQNLLVRKEKLVCEIALMYAADLL